MARLRREDVDRYFDYDIWLENRTLYIGANQTHPIAGVEDYDLDDISAATAERVIKGLSLLDNQATDKPIKIILNSPGGDPIHALAIYDAIRRCESEVQILATGQCMSSAMIILQAADLREVSKHCWLMIHDGTESYSGNSADFSKWAKMAEQLNQQIYNIFSEASGKAASYFSKKCKHDYILTAEEAVKEGLADQVV
jgi:ATP-dependent Clp protease protease subunit